MVAWHLLQRLEKLLLFVLKLMFIRLAIKISFVFIGISCRSI
jgi:hypothetical protein